MTILGELWQELEGYLETKTEVGDLLVVPVPGDRERTHEVVELRVTVCNTAPVVEQGPRIVFMGVMLSSSTIRNFRRSRWEIGITRGTESHRLNYGEALTPGPLPEAITSDEHRFGEVLFPGERVTFNLRVPANQLPDQIRVHALVSRRHLFAHTRSLVLKGT